MSESIDFSTKWEDEPIVLPPLSEEEVQKNLEASRWNFEQRVAMNLARNQWKNTWINTIKK